MEENKTRENRSNLWVIIFGILLLLLLFLILGKLWQITSYTKHTAEINTTVYEKTGMQPCTVEEEIPDICEIQCMPNEEELKMARIAWKYIENNFNEKTGLINAAHKFPSAATWDWANGLFAIFAAKKFHIIDEDRYDEMMNKFLTQMQKIPLFNNELPNKTYNVQKAKMSDYRNKLQEDGIGWSAADLARFLQSLNLIEQCEPNHAPAVEKLLLRFNFCRTFSVDGDMYGGTLHHGKISIAHEALTGYEEYLSRGFNLWNLPGREAREYKFLKEVEVYGIKIPTDTRAFFSNFIESEPFWFLGFEYGIDDPESSKYIHNMYKVQEERYKRTGQITAVTEDNIDRSPYFLFNTVYTHNEPWKTINQMGEDYDEYKWVSTKAAVGMHMLFNTPYTRKVFDYIKKNYHPDKGYYAGIYEKIPGPNRALTLNTNAVILEAILSKAMGRPLQHLRKVDNRGIYDHYRNTVNNFRCMPLDRGEMLVLEPYHPNIPNDLTSQKIQNEISASQAIVEEAEE